MVTCGGDADPAGALPGRIKPALIMARPSRVGSFISFTFSLTSSLAASGCPVLIGTLRPINFAMSATNALQLYSSTLQVAPLVSSLARQR